MCVIWGVPYLLIRVAVRELAPSVLVFSRTATATLLLLPVAALRRELRVLVPYWLPVLLFAVIEIAVPWLLLSRAEQHLSSSLSALLIASVPLISAVMVLFTGHEERLGGRRLAGLLIGLVGVAAIVGLDVGGSSVVALLEIAGVAVSYALGPIILSRYLSELPSLGVIAASLALCAIGYAPFAVTSLPSSVPSGRVLASVAALAVLCTGFAFIVFFALVAEVGPVRSTVITYINPAVAALLGVLILNERFTAGMGVGFVLVLAGSVLATRRTVGAGAEAPAVPVVPEP